MFSFGRRVRGSLLAAALAVGWAGAALAAPPVQPGAAPPAPPAASPALARVTASADEPEPQSYHATLPVRGRTMGADEPIVFGGLAAVDATLIRAPGSPPIAEVAMDFSGVSARGEQSGLPYHVANPTRLQRRLAQPQAVDITFAYYREDDPLSARSTTASFRMAGSGKPGRQLAVGFIPDDEQSNGKPPRE